MDKSSYARKDRLVKEREHDVYRSRAKLPGSTLCSECGAVFSNGRWVWSEPPQDAKVPAFRLPGKTVCSFQVSSVDRSKRRVESVRSAGTSTARQKRTS